MLEIKSRHLTLGGPLSTTIILLFEVLWIQFEFLYLYIQLTFKDYLLVSNDLEYV